MSNEDICEYIRDQYKKCFDIKDDYKRDGCKYYNEKKLDELNCNKSVTCFKWIYKGNRCEDKNCFLFYRSLYDKCMEMNYSR